MKAYEVSFRPEDVAMGGPDGVSCLEIVNGKTYRHLPLCRGRGAFCIVLAAAMSEVAQAFPEAKSITELPQYGYTIRDILGLRGDPPQLTEQAD